MSDPDIELTYQRLQTKLQARFASLAEAHPKQWKVFLARLREHFPGLLERLVSLYGTRYDFFYHLEELAAILAEGWLARPPALKKLDAEREKNPRWFLSNRMLGGVVYVDLFAENLEGLARKIPYFKELGLTFLHLMPLFKVPEPENDGGYAVTSYREVNPALGTMKQLRALASALHKAGIVLVVDFVFNHTALDHDWAKRAMAGDPEFQDYYFVFPDRTMPDAYDRTLREIFPDVRRGSFTRVSRTRGLIAPEVVANDTLENAPLDDAVLTNAALANSPLTPGPSQGMPFTAEPRPGMPLTPSPSPKGRGGQEDEVWVWTTFNSFQWDLNYRNPAVLNSMAREMLFLANQGVDVLRLDAVAFIWKELGTNCENLPEAHTVIRVFNLLARIAAPGLLFKSEAIVHPDEVVKYISAEECQLSYNPLLMALLWNSLATRKTRLLNRSMARRFAIPADTAWVNYVRVHDDIGWTFDDEDAWRLGINGYDHRRFLNDFFAGKFPGSFARGLPFQYNPDTGDLRISGTGASLAGLEQALADKDETEIELAIRRILLIHGIILLIGGVPLIYIGDEIGTLNDYSYKDDPSKANDSRWVHRPRFNWQDASKRKNPSTIQGRVYGGLHELIALRQNQDVFAGGAMRVRESGNDHLFAFERGEEQRIVVVSNFSEAIQPLYREALRRQVSDGTVLYGDEFLLEADSLAPYGLVVVFAERNSE